MLEWQGDLVLTPNGSIQYAVGWDQIRERIIRRFLTNRAQQLPDGSYTLADYVFDVNYGVGAGALVDQNPTRAWLLDLTGRMRQAVQADAAVDPGALPQMTVVKQGGNTYQLFVQVQLVSGQSGKVAIVFSGPALPAQGGTTVTSPSGGGGSSSAPPPEQTVTYIEDDFGTIIVDDSGTRLAP